MREIETSRQVARIIHETDPRQHEIEGSLATIRELRKRTGRITVTELIAARDEGRKS